MTRTRTLTTTYAVLCAAALLFAAGATQADTISLVDDNGYGESWETGSAWSDGSPASTGNDYLVEPHDPDAPIGRMRTPDRSNDDIFPGDSLTVQNGGSIMLKGNSRTITFDDLTMDGATMQNSTGGKTYTIAGNLLVGSGGAQFSSSADDRHITLSALISGSGTLSANVGGGANLIIENSANTWDGDLRARRGNLEVKYALDNGGSLLKAEGGAWDLGGFDHTFGLGSTVGKDEEEVELSLGTFTASELNGVSSGGTDFSGDGTVTIIPEPATMALVALGGVGLLLKRRRSRS